MGPFSTGRRGRGPGRSGRRRRRPNSADRLREKKAKEVEVEPGPETDIVGGTVAAGRRVSLLRLDQAGVGQLRVLRWHARLVGLGAHRRALRRRGRDGGEPEAGDRRQPTQQRGPRRRSKRHVDPAPPVLERDDVRQRRRDAAPGLRFHEAVGPDGGAGRPGERGQHGPHHRPWPHDPGRRGLQRPPPGRSPDPIRRDDVGCRPVRIELPRCGDDRRRPARGRPGQLPGRQRWSAVHLRWPGSPRRRHELGQRLRPAQQAGHLWRGLPGRAAHVRQRNRGPSLERQLRRDDHHGRRRDGLRQQHRRDGSDRGTQHCRQPRRHVRLVQLDRARERADVVQHAGCGVRHDPPRVHGQHPRNAGVGRVQ